MEKKDDNRIRHIVNMCRYSNGYRRSEGEVMEDFMKGLFKLAFVAIVYVFAAGLFIALVEWVFSFSIDVKSALTGMAVMAIADMFFTIYGKDKGEEG